MTNTPITHAKKSVFSLLLALAMVFTALPLGAFAQESDSPPLGHSGTVTGFAYLEPIEVKAGTVETDIPFPATVTATVSLDSAATPAETVAGESSVDVTVGEWRLAWGEYDPDAQNTRYVFEAVRESLALPDGITLPEDVDLPAMAVDIGEVELGIMPVATTIGDGMIFDLTTTHAASGDYTGSVSGTATWDSGTKKLTLNDFKHNGGRDGIELPSGGAEIELIGDSEITIPNNNNYTLQGIYVPGALTITGTGSLKITNGSNSGASGTFSNYGINVGGALVVKGDVTLDITGGAARGTSFGVRGSSSLTVEGGATVKGTGTNSIGTENNGNSYGVQATTITVKENGTLEGIGGTSANYKSTGVRGTAIYVYGDGTIIGEGGTAGGTSAPMGVETTSPSGAAPATGTGGASNSDSDPLTFVSPTYKLTDGTIAKWVLLEGGGAEEPDGGAEEPGGGGAPAPADFTLKFARESGSWKLRKFKNGNSEGDYTATGISFSGDTLTLNSFSFTTTAGTALETGDGARIVLTGTNTLEGDDQAIETTGNLSISGTGTLNANSGIAVINGDMSISGGTVNATAIGAGSVSGLALAAGEGVNDSEHVLRVSGGTLNVKGDEFGIGTMGPIYVTESGKITAEGGDAAIVSYCATAPTAATIQGKMSTGTLGAVIWTTVAGEGGDMYFYSTGGTMQTIATYVELNGGGTTPTPTPSSGSSGGSSNQTTPAPAPVISPMDNKSSGTLGTAINAAASAASSDGKNFDVRLKNVSNFTKENAAAIIAKAKSLGKPATVSSDVMSENGRFVEVRVTVDPALITKTVRLDGYIRESQIMQTASRFTKHFSNKTAVVHLAQEGKFGQTAKISAKVDLNGFDSTNLFLYSYDRKANKYSLITSKDYKIDKNGYLVFNTDFGGDVIISNGKLEKK